MARKSSSPILQEELYPQPDEPARPELDDARLVDLDVEDEPRFLRGQKRVSVRRGTIPKKTAARLTWTALAVIVVFLGGLAVAAVYHYGEHSWRFRVGSSDDIQTTGLGNVTRAQIMEVMGEDIGRNIFFIPLEQRQKQIEQIPWVESASVMRFVPNRVRISIQERSPVAFARVGSKVFLIDATGALMELPVAGKKKFSFPVILGMNLGEPQSTRAARMKLYNQLVSELDSGGARYSQNISEVDLSDSEDVKAMASDPGGEVLVHLGSSDFLERFKIYVSHVQEWRQQFARLDSVDLRYQHQIVVNPDLQGAVKEPPLSMSATKVAMAAGVKQAALVSHEPAVVTPSPAKTAAVKIMVRPAAKKRAKARRKKAALKKASLKTKRVYGPSPATASKSAAPAQPPAAQKPAPVTPLVVTTTTPGSKPSPSVPKGQH